MTSLTLDLVAQLIGCAAPPDGGRTLTGVNTLADATETELSFIGSDAFLKQLATTRAAAVIVQKRVKLPPGPRPVVFVVDDADLAIAQVLRAIAPPVPRPPAGVDRMARVAPSASLAPDVALGPFVFIGERSRIGAGTILHPGVFIGDDSVVGEGCELFANVVVRERVTIGSRVIIHAGSVLGSDGFGYRWDGREHAKIPQIGEVVVEDDVEIGSCVCIDRAKFSRTVVGRGTKIDNLVQIGHNVRVGEHCIIVGQAGLAGSVVLGRNVILGGQSAVRDHVTIGDGVKAAACCAIAENIEPNTVVSGVPALPHRQTLREQAALRRLPDLLVQVRRLQEQLDKLSAQPAAGGPLRQ
jgi:UDP-3-O-[3-hydroxymyristoyl] glucosamine N-acyltransferase